MSLISAKMLCDSISSSGVRLITLQLKGPKFLDAEFEKHRMISSNSSSDRAIPLKTILKKEYFLPEDVRLNEAGMQGEDTVGVLEIINFHNDLINMRSDIATILSKWDHVHKQHLKYVPQRKINILLFLNYVFIQRHSLRFMNLQLK